MSLNNDKKLVNINEVNEGPRVYVDKINITGNTRTVDKVIRREFSLQKVMHIINLQLIIR